MRSRPIDLPQDRLPDDARARHTALRDYFCDKDAEVVRTAAGWRLDLGWPGGVDRHVDRELEVAFDWWGGGVVRETMAHARRRDGRFLHTLYDTWTLHSWSQWAANGVTSQGNRVVVLHVDDHFDLAPPRLIADTSGLRDAISGAKFDFLQPASVQAAILSGALGMGSFMTPFLHFAPEAEVRHLRQPPKTRRTVDYAFRRTTVQDTLLHPNAPRPAIQLIETEGASGPGSYRLAVDVGDWLNEIGEGPILLHIDMDYFNNRYDGDSDWAERPERLDPSLSAILRRIDELTDALRTAKVLNRLEDIVIAFSPGFFPAEFWAVADARLRAGLA